MGSAVLRPPASLVAGDRPCALMVSDSAAAAVPGHFGGESRARADGVGSLSPRVAGGLGFPAGLGRPTWEGLWAGVWGKRRQAGLGAQRPVLEEPGWPGGLGAHGRWGGAARRSRLWRCGCRLATCPQVLEEDWPGADTQPRLDGGGSRGGDSGQRPRGRGLLGALEGPGGVRHPRVAWGALRSPSALSACVSLLLGPFQEHGVVPLEWTLPGRALSLDPLVTGGGRGNEW